MRGGRAGLSTVRDSHRIARHQLHPTTHDPLAAGSSPAGPPSPPRFLLRSANSDACLLRFITIRVRRTPVIAGGSGKTTGAGSGPWCTAGDTQRTTKCKRPFVPEEMLGRHCGYRRSSGARKVLTHPEAKGAAAERVSVTPLWARLQTHLFELLSPAMTSPAMRRQRRWHTWRLARG